MLDVRGTRVLILTLLVSFGATSCSIPSLESPACTESKNAVREFYSYHFGNEMHPSEANIEARSKFLTSSFKQEVLKAYHSGAGVKEGDEFTKTLNDPPKTFRVGECREVSPEHTEVSVLILWRDDDRTDQRQLKVEAVDKNDTWLINAISLLPR